MIYIKGFFYIQKIPPSPAYAKKDFLYFIKKRFFCLCF